jgi:hypothetical protein
MLSQTFPFLIPFEMSLYNKTLPVKWQMYDPEIQLRLYPGHEKKKKKLLYSEVF